MIDSIQQRTPRKLRHQPRQLSLLLLCQPPSLISRPATPPRRAAPLALLTSLLPRLADHVLLHARRRLRRQPAALRPILLQEESRRRSLLGGLRGLTLPVPPTTAVAASAATAAGGATAAAPAPAATPRSRRSRRLREKERKPSACSTSRLPSRERKSRREENSNERTRLASFGLRLACHR